MLICPVNIIEVGDFRFQRNLPRAVALMISTCAVLPRRFAEPWFTALIEETSYRKPGFTMFYLYIKVWGGVLIKKASLLAGVGFALMN